MGVWAWLALLTWAGGPEGLKRDSAQPALKLGIYAPYAPVAPEEAPPVLHFETRVEVEARRDPNEMLAAFLAGREPAVRAPGTPADGNEARPRQASGASGDLLPMLNWLAHGAAHALGVAKDHHYFLYELESGSQRMAVLREEQIPAAATTLFPQVRARLVTETKDRNLAVRAFRELESAAKTVSR